MLSPAASAGHAVQNTCQLLPGRRALPESRRTRPLPEPSRRRERRTDPGTSPTAHTMTAKTLTTPIERRRPTRPLPPTKQPRVSLRPVESSFIASTNNSLRIRCLSRTTLGRPRKISQLISYHDLSRYSLSSAVRKYSAAYSKNPISLFFERHLGGVTSCPIEPLAVVWTRLPPTAASPSHRGRWCGEDPGEVDPREATYAPQPSTTCANCSCTSPGVMPTMYGCFVTEAEDANGDLGSCSSTTWLHRLVATARSPW